ncbi:GAF domain-containing protein [Deinococcus budaensis]|uniref:histidine kinase n=1 Tax=Deinococcus budaensis TaxID=1665626 RepID=A0A7W8GE12_9DEIO|nr:GAF domain-containing protein [Deinococcus budaensis]MBB5233876.1 signal transduction histidine kinase/transcriptional regulator with GAF, ATPase, and Fis domain [Deinococcus budaensis]
MSSQPAAATPPLFSSSLSAQLQNVTEALAAARTRGEVFGVVLDSALEALKADAGAVLLVGDTGQHLRLAAVKGQTEQAQTRWQDGPLGDGTPGGDALKRREALFFEHEGDLVRAYPQLETRTGGVGAVATAVVPMSLDRQPLGVLILDFEEPRTFTPEERRFLQTLAAQCALGLGRVCAHTAQERGAEQLRGLAQAALQIHAARGVQATLAVITEQARALIGAHQAVVSSTISDDWAQSINAVSLSDKYAAWREHAGQPGGSGIYALVCRMNRPLRLTQAELEAHPAWRGFGEHAAEHLPLRGWLAVPLVGQDGQNIGLIQLSDRLTGDFTPEDESVLVQLAQLAAISLENARLYETAQDELTRRQQAEQRLRDLNLDLERRVETRTRELAAATQELEDRAAALDAFVAFSEVVGSQSEVLALARRATQVVRANLEHVSAAYYELEAGLWRARVWSDDVAPEVAAQIEAGVPQDAPDFAQAVLSPEGVYVDGWDAEANHVGSTGSYGAVAFFPLFVGDKPRSLFVVGTQDARVWTEREKAVFRAVGRSLGLALERADVTARLETQNAELEARTRALEGFAHLTQDLAAQSDPGAFVLRAQEVVLSLLPPGYALYYEREGERWRNRVQVGEVRNAELQAFIDAGPLVGVTPSVDVPWTTRHPYYQDSYARGSDTPEEMVQHVSAAASLPVLRHGEVVGVFIAVLFENRVWTRTDKVVLETVVGSLGLALERAESVALLAQRTRELEHSNVELARSNAELEQFAYIASHDLQAPIRAVTSFAGIIEHRYGQHLDERGRLYLRQIVDSGEHMKRLVDDLLAFSRVHTQQRDLLPVDSAAVFDAVARRLHDAAEALGAQITRGELPRVQADAQQLDQLLQNLISNGLKYHREGVRPQVRVTAERDGDGLWRFQVTDNGIGIEPQYFERIFVIFQRLHGREAFEGTGIGLAVCKKIVERHGGRLWLESTPGQGSSFFFTLPGA